jgi:hypothetical protein
LDVVRSACSREKGRCHQVRHLGGCQDRVSVSVQALLIGLTLK